MTSEERAEPDTPAVSAKPPSRGLATLFAVLPVAVAAWIGNRATLPAIPVWYENLAKPAFTPPNAVFGPVWTFLFVVMILSFRRILRTPPETPGRRRAIGLFLLQIALNASWSVVFFGLRAPGAAVFVILALDFAVAATIAAFARIDRPAGFVLVPYLAWIGFATALDVGVWWLAG